jgi:hypothetical protein
VCGHHPASLIDPVPAVLVCALAGNIWPGKKRVDQGFACKGADENSWQSRPRHAVTSPTPGRLPPPRETAADLPRVMLLLDVSTMARNVGHHLVFAASRDDEHAHSDLVGCADCVTDALQARQTARFCSWHACASVWIATSFRPHPRMHKHANTWWSMHLHTLLLDTSKAQLACMACTCAEALQLDMSKALTAHGTTTCLLRHCFCIQHLQISKDTEHLLHGASLMPLKTSKGDQREKSRAHQLLSQLSQTKTICSLPRLPVRQRDWTKKRRGATKLIQLLCSVTCAVRALSARP